MPPLTSFSDLSCEVSSIKLNYVTGLLEGLIQDMCEVLSQVLAWQRVCYIKLATVIITLQTLKQHELRECNPDSNDNNVAPVASSTLAPGSGLAAPSAGTPTPTPPAPSTAAASCPFRSWLTSFPLPSQAQNRLRYPLSLHPAILAFYPVTTPTQQQQEHICFFNF